MVSIQLLYYEDQQLEHEGYHKGGRAQQHHVDFLYNIETFSGVAESKPLSTVNICLKCIFLFVLEKINMIYLF